MAVVYEYRRGDQLEKYIGQFMRIFSGFQVEDGVERDGTRNRRRVPVVYGNMSRVTASILTNRDHLSAKTLPIMAANMIGLTPDRENKKTPYHRDERSLRVVPEYERYDVVDRLTGPAFIMNMELSVYASSTTELFDIIEQILLIFNPRVAIQTSSSLVDSTYITDVSLVEIRPEIQYPIGTENSAVVMTLVFEVPVRLKYPQGFNDKIISQIVQNVKSADSEDTVTGCDILGDTGNGDIIVVNR